MPLQSAGMEGAGWEKSRTECQRRYIGKPLFEQGLPKRPVPNWRIRPSNKGILAAKEYMPRPSARLLPDGQDRTHNKVANELVPGVDGE